MKWGGVWKSRICPAEKDNIRLTRVNHDVQTKPLRWKVPEKATQGKRRSLQVLTDMDLLVWSATVQYSLLLLGIIHGSRDGEKSKKNQQNIGHLVHIGLFGTTSIPDFSLVFP